jgi:hypothetical protein
MSFPVANFSSVVGFFTYVTNITDGWFGNVLILLSWIILTVVMTRWGAVTSFTVSSFVNMILAILLMMVGIVSEQITLILIISTVVGILILWGSE